MAKPITDDDGNVVTAGCVICFGYGIPPIGVEAKVVERKGKLIALTPGHNPTECEVSFIKKWFNFWIVTKSTT